MDERNAKIEMFLEKWNEMLDAANEIEGFTWMFRVRIDCDDSMIHDRIKTIAGINESFAIRDALLESDG